MNDKNFIKFIEKFELTKKEIENLKIEYKKSEFMIKIFEKIDRIGIIGLNKDESNLIYNLYKKGII